MSVTRDHDPASATQYAERYFDDEVVADLCNKAIIPRSVTDCMNFPKLQYYQMRDVIRTQLGKSYGDAMRLFEIYKSSRCPLVSTPSVASATYGCQFQFSKGYNLTLVFDSKTNVMIDVR